MKIDKKHSPPKYVDSATEIRRIETKTLKLQVTKSFGDLILWFLQVFKNLLQVTLKNM